MVASFTANVYQVSQSILLSSYQNIHVILTSLQKWNIYIYSAGCIFNISIKTFRYYYVTVIFIRWLLDYHDIILLELYGKLP